MTANVLNSITDGQPLAQYVTIAIAAGATNSFDATITVKDAKGNTVAAVHNLEVWISEAATGIGLTADSYSGAVTASTGAVLTALTAKKHLIVSTAATGIAVINAVDSAKPADQYVVVKNPIGGTVTVSAASGTSWGA